MEHKIAIRDGTTSFGPITFFLDDVIQITRMDREIPSVEPLLGTDSTRVWWGVLILPTVMLTSATGMLTLKFSQQNDNAIALTTGYLLEGIAFAIYPYALRYHTLRFVSTSWASSGILVSYIGGYVIYNETPSTTSIIGGMLIIAGVCMTLL